MSRKYHVISLKLGMHMHTHKINLESTGSMKWERSTKGFRCLQTLLVV